MRKPEDKQNSDKKVYANMLTTLDLFKTKQNSLQVTRRKDMLLHVLIRKLIQSIHFMLFSAKTAFIVYKVSTSL